MSESEEKGAASVTEILSQLEDLEHQIWSPVNQAHWRANLAIECRDGDELRRHLYAIRGLCGKARQVLRSIRAFTGLNKNRPMKMTLVRLTEVDLARMAIEAVTDATLLVDPRRRIRHSVQRDGFHVLDSVSVWADLDLVQQSLSNLMDNAGKYSYDGTEITVKAGMTKTRRFFLAVVNSGIPISSRDVEMCKERGWRGEWAEAAIGVGSGIGLWIVDNIMRSHGGALEVNPTDTKGFTTIRLTFPVGEK